MLSNRFYILRVCVPIFLLPFLPPIRKQFLLESECGENHISIYIIIDKLESQKPILYYSILFAIKRCKELNKKELDEKNRQETKNKKTEMAEITIKLKDDNKFKESDTAIIDAENLHEEIEFYKDIKVSDLKAMILNDSKHNLIPTENKKQTELFTECIDCILNHRVSLLSSIEEFIKKSVPTLEKEKKPGSKYKNG